MAGTASVPLWPENSCTEMTAFNVVVNENLSRS